MSGTLQHDGAGDGAGAEVAGARTSRTVTIVAIAVVLALVTTLAVMIGRSGDEPPVIRLGASSSSPTSSAEADQLSVAQAELTIWNPVSYRFEVADGARIGAGEAAAWQLVPPDDLEAAASEIAERFGVGAVTASPFGDHGYHAGSTDGTGPTLWVGADGSWSFHDPTGGPDWVCETRPLPQPDDERDRGTTSNDSTRSEEDRTSGAGTEESADADAATGGSDGEGSDARTGDGEGVDGVAEPPIALEECTSPTPPTGVPSADRARELAQELFGDLDLPGEVVVTEATSDEWGAWVSATIELDGLATGLWVSAGWSGDERLSSLSGTFADAERVGEYPTVDAESAVERLEGAGHGLYRAVPTPAMDQPVSSGDLAITDGAESSGAPATTDDPIPVEPQPDAPIGEEPIVDEPMPDVSMPVEPLPDELELEEVTVTLVDVEPTLLLQWDVDGAVWLLPGYRFTDAEGGVWDVLAVTDDYLDTDAEVAADGDGDGEDATEPAPPVDAGEGGTGGADAPPADPNEVETIDPDEGGGVDGDPGSGAEPGDLEDIERRMQEEAAAAQAVADGLVGLTEDEAVRAIEDAGLTARVTARDGERFEITMDYSTGRINLEIDDGTVTAASVG